MTATAGNALSGVASMSLFIDSVLQGTLTAPPFEFAANTYTLTAGSHAITVKALDPVGNQSEATVRINVPVQLAVEIVSPTTGTTINRSSTTIKGKLTQKYNREAAVIVNNRLAEVNGNDFAAVVSLQQGQNVIAVTALNEDGLLSRASVTINTEVQQGQIRLNATPASGITMFKQNGAATFDTSLTAEASLLNAVANYSWDTNNDGTPDQVGAELSTIAASYQTPGLYFPTVTITDVLGNTYSESTIVNVVDRMVIDALLRAKWEGMKAKLANQDIGGAVAFFDRSSQDRYTEVFTALREQLPQMAQSMQNIQLIYSTSGIAKYRIRKDELYGGQMMTLTYYIYFTMDSTGMWKLDKF